MPATSQMRCWLLPNGRIFPAAAGASLRFEPAFFRVARTSAQRGLFLSRRARTRCLGRRPHTTATRGSRCGADTRHTRRVDRADCFHGQKIGTIGTLLRYVSAKIPFSLRAATLSRTNRVTFFGVIPRLPSGSIFADSADGEPRYSGSARSNSEKRCTS